MKGKWLKRIMVLFWPKMNYAMLYKKKYKHLVNSISKRVGTGGLRLVLFYKYLSRDDPYQY